MKCAIGNMKTTENETYERERRCTEECQPNLVAAGQQPASGLNGDELSEELTEFLLVKLQELKAGTFTAGDAVSSRPVARQVTDAQRCTSRTGASSDAQ